MKSLVIQSECMVVSVKETTDVFVFNTPKVTEEIVMALCKRVPDGTLTFQRAKLVTVEEDV